MSFTLKLNPITNDLEIKDGKFVYVKGAEEVRQRVSVALQHYKYEYFLDVTKGVPYYDAMLGTKSTKDVMSKILRQVIFNVPGVKSIISFSSNYNFTTRTYAPVANITAQRNSTDPIDYIVVNGIFVEV